MDIDFQPAVKKTARYPHFPGRESAADLLHIFLNHAVEQLVKWGGGLTEIDEDQLERAHQQRQRGRQAIHAFEWLCKRCRKQKARTCALCQQSATTKRK